MSNNDKDNLDELLEELDDNTLVAREQDLAIQDNPPVSIVDNIDIINAEMDKMDYSEEFKDTLDATRNYINDSFEIEKEIQDLRNQQKALKADAKEEGVKVSMAGRAIKELVQELKESSEDSKCITDMKRFIKSDSNMYDNIVMKAG